MNSVKRSNGNTLATTAASLLLAGASMSFSASSMAEEAKVNCMGVNNCKGMTACATASNSCKGMNSCKGQGWLPMTKKECDDKGGKVAG